MDFGPGDVRFFDRVAPLYDRLMPRARRAPLQDALTFSERPVETVLDVAGGTGRVTRALSDIIGPAGDVVVVDGARGMLEVARERGNDCVQADATTLPVRDDAVDAVTVVDALHHIENQRAVVREARRVLAPGGVLVVADFDPETLRGRALTGVEHLVGFDSVFTGVGDVARFLEQEGFTARIVRPGFDYVVVGRV